MIGLAATVLKTALRRGFQRGIEDYITPLIEEVVYSVFRLFGNFLRNLLNQKWPQLAIP